MSNAEVPNIKLNDKKLIPALGLGTYLMEADECESAVATALEVGYRHIDTATVYRNELEVGRAIANSGVPREDVFLTTKLANAEQRDPLGGFERSLERLSVDYVDLYLLHWPLPKRDSALGAWEGIVKIAETGRARSIGVCNFEIEHLEAIISATGVVPAVNQIELHPEHQREELKVFCAEKGIAIEAWGPLAQLKSDLLERTEVLAAAKAHEKSAAQVILRWHIEKGHIVIPKSANSKRILENFEIFDFALSASEIAAIDSYETAHNYGPDPRSYDG